MSNKKAAVTVKRGGKSAHMGDTHVKRSGGPVKGIIRYSPKDRSK